MWSWPRRPLRNWLGFDDAAVARTGQIDGRGYGGRLKLEQMWNQGRPVDPKFLALAKFLFAYGYGNPGKMPVEGGKHNTLVFGMTHGYAPWDDRVDPLRERTAAMIKAKEAREKREASPRGLEGPGRARRDQGRHRGRRRERSNR